MHNNEQVTQWFGRAHKWLDRQFDHDPIGKNAIEYTGYWLMCVVMSVVLAVPSLVWIGLLIISPAWRVPVWLWNKIKGGK